MYRFKQRRYKQLEREIVADSQREAKKAEKHTEPDGQTSTFVPKLKAVSASWETSNHTAFVPISI
jgi:hypothetical protein